MTVIVGFDLALQRTGWAIVDEQNKAGKDRWGSWKAPGPKYPKGMRLHYIRTEVRRVLDEALFLTGGETYSVTVTFEDLVTSFQIRSLGPVRGVAEEAVWDMLETPIRLVSPKSVKVLACNDGNADKPDMIRAAADHLGYTGNIDDEADALWIADFTARSLGWDRPPIPSDNLRALDIEVP